MSSYKFIASGVVCDINDDKADIERNVQYVIDERCGGYAKLRYEKLADNKVRLIYFRDLIYPNGHKIIFDSDMALLSGFRINAYQETGNPIIYPLEYAGKNYYTATIAFLRLYDFMVYRETKGHTQKIRARMYSDRIVLEIEFKEGGNYA